MARGDLLHCGSERWHGGAAPWLVLITVALLLLGVAAPASAVADPVRTGVDPSALSNLIIPVWGASSVTGIESAAAVAAEDLEAPGGISGTVTYGATGVPGTGVWAIYVDTGGWVAYASTDADGAYGLTGLEPGAYHLYFEGPAGYLPQWYAGAFSEADATAVQVFGGQTASGVNAVLETPGHITGAVKDAEDDALGGISVYAYRQWGTTWDYVGYGYTDSNGTYDIGGLATGTYWVQFYPSDTFVPEWYDNAVDMENAADVPVTAGQTTSGIDAVLDTPGHIAGTVTDADGPVPAGMYVYVYTTGYSYVGYAQTAADGGYDVGGLSPGDYKVYFGGDATHTSQWYSARQSFEEADLVAVTAGATTFDIDARLFEFSAISGSVTGDGQPLYQAVVDLYRLEDGGSMSYMVWTQSDGTYTCTGIPAGTYRVRFRDSYWWWTQQYVTEFWNDRFSEAAADLITLREGEQLTGIDAAMNRPGTISGRVTDAGGRPVRNLTVSLHGKGETLHADTDRNGYYSCTGLLPGAWKVQFDDWYGRYLPEWYDDKPDKASADPVVVALDEQVTGVDAVLTEFGGRVTGTVADAGGKPLKGIGVVAYRRDGHGYWDYMADTSTDATGAYTLRGLAPASYRIAFRDWGHEYLDEFYDDKGDIDLADPVGVEQGVTTKGIDAQLAKAARVVGHVTNEAGEPLAGISVVAYSADGDGGWAYMNDTSTDAAGAYRLRGLAPDAYRVGFFDSWRRGVYAPEYWDDAANVYDADDIPLGVGETATADATLAQGGRIEGTLTGEGGGPAAGVWVVAYRRGDDGFWQYVRDVTTDAAGRYAVGGLATGIYRVRFSDDWGWPSRYRYLDEVYDNVRTLEEGSDIAVTLGEVTAPIDAELSPGGSVSGRVTGPDGEPLKGAWVAVYAQNDDSGRWNYVADTSTDVAGDYHLRTLYAGSYKVQFTPSWRHGTLVGEWYDDKPAIDLADPVSVESGLDTGGIDAQLSEGGVITGNVTADGLGAVAGVRVYAYAEDPDEGWQRVNDATTDAAGVYTMRGLWSGTYRLEYRAGPGLDLAAEAWNDKPAVVLGDDVAVAAGAVLGGYDAVLAPAAHIAGTVYEADGSTPLRGAVVRAYLPGGPLGRILLSETATAADGTYDVGELPAGDYTVRFSHAGDYAPQWYDKQGTPEGADTLSVTAGEHRSGIDAVLGPPAVVTGTVTDSGGNGLSDMRVEAYRASSVGWVYVADVTTDASGHYRMTGLGDGKYNLYFSDAWMPVHIPEWFDDAVDQAGAEVLTLVAGDQATADASLRHAGEIVSLGSSTHPDETAWYQAVDAAFEWAAADPLRIAGYSYVVDQSPTSPAPRRITGTSTSAALTGIPDGTWYFHVRAAVGVDWGGGGGGGAGLAGVGVWRAVSWGPTSHFAVHIDNTAPLTTPLGAGGWHNHDVTVTLSPLDEGSGMTGGAAATEYRVEGTAGWTSGTEVTVPAPADHSNDGVHRVYFRSTDALGNVEAEKWVDVRIDTVAPKTSDDAGDGWHTTDFQLQLSAADAGQVDRTEYSVDGGPWRTGTSVAFLPPLHRRVTSRLYGVRYRSVDAAGNIENVRECTVRIDRRNPRTTSDFDGLPHNSDVLITLQPGDADSGLAGTWYSVDGGDWVPGTQVPVAAPQDHSNDGWHAVAFFSADQAGNEEPVRSVDVLIDTLAPNIGDDAGEGWHPNGWTLTLTATDAGSGVAATEYSVDGGDWRSGLQRVFRLRTKRLSTSGASRVFVVSYRSRDAAGNATGVATCTVRIDARAPITWDDATGLPSATDVTVHLASDDGESGVATTWYSIDGEDWQQGTDVPVAAPLDHSGDGIRTIAYYSVDVVGNIEPYRTCTVVIDTTP